MARFEIWGRTTEAHQPDRPSMKSGVDRCGLMDKEDTKFGVWPDREARYKAKGWERKEEVGDDPVEAQVIFKQHLKRIGEGWQNPA